MRTKDPKNIIKTKYGNANLHHKNKIKQTIQRALNRHSRISLIRLDLHFPDIDIHYVMDYEAISRFFKYVNEQVPAHLRRKIRQLKLFNPEGRVHETSVGYFWGREYGKETYLIGKKIHYHIALLLNYDTFNNISYNKSDTENLYIVIAKCWLKAIDIHELKYANLVHIPKNPVYTITRKDLTEKGIDGIYESMADRLDYIIKFRDKDFHNNRRSFGCSQGQG